MKRSELELAIVTATSIIEQDQVLVIGSQAVLGSFDEALLPARATASQEVDMAPLDDDVHEHLATRLDALAGEWSAFDERHGFYIQGVSVRTALLPEGWADRLVHVRPTRRPGVVGLCLEPHDVCAAKLARNDPKDREFVDALIRAGLVDPGTVRQRIEAIRDPRLPSALRATALRLMDGYRRR